MTASPLTRNNFKVVSVLIKFSDPENPNNKISTLIDKSSVLQFEYREGLLNQFISVTLQIADTTSQLTDCLLYTSPSPRDRPLSRMPSSA